MKFGDYTVCGYSSSSIKACLKVNKRLNISVSICREITKIDSDMPSRPLFQSIFNTASRRCLVNKRLNISVSVRKYLQEYKGMPAYKPPYRPRRLSDKMILQPMLSSPYTKVCRGITKIDSDMPSRPLFQSIFNTASRRCLVNERLNQRNFNRFVLPCPGWGVRGGLLSKIKKLLTSDSVLIRDLTCLFLI